MKKMTKNKGFTLIELVVVIAILGILAGIAIPRFMDATATARGARILADMRTLDSVATMYYARAGTYPTLILTQSNSAQVALIN
jgi:prepilin-type N-terminal cleavage/methylation domain-containing protein